MTSRRDLAVIGREPRVEAAVLGTVRLREIFPTAETAPRTGAAPAPGVVRGAAAAASMSRA